MLPDQPINVVYRSGPVGHHRRCSTTSCRTSRPTSSTRGRPGTICPTTVRIIQLDSSPNFAPQDPGARRLRPDRAVRRQRQRQVVDRLRRVRLREDLRRARRRGCRTRRARACSRTRRTSRPRSSRRRCAPTSARSCPGVYKSPNPARVPDLGVQLHRDPVRARRPTAPTCKGDVLATRASPRRLATWMRYIACDGQVNMAAHRLLAAAAEPLAGDRQLDRPDAGHGAEALNAGNCADPRFSGSLGAGASSPVTRCATVQSLGGTGSGRGRERPACFVGADGSGGRVPLQARPAAPRSPPAEGVRRTATSTPWRTRPSPPATPGLPVLAFLALIALPPAVVSVVLDRRKRRKRAASTGPTLD